MERWATALLLSGCLLIVSSECRPKPAAKKAPSPILQQQQEETWRRYWQDVVGVTDKKQLDQVQRAENAQNQVYRQMQQRISSLRLELKVGLTEGTLTPGQSDSLLNEIAHLSRDLERMGIQGWKTVDSLLSPVQRKNRLAQLKISPNRLMNRVNVAPGKTEEDTTQ